MSLCKYSKCKNKIRYKIKNICQKHYMMEYKKKNDLNYSIGYKKRKCIRCSDKYKPKASNQKYCKKCQLWNRSRINKKSRRRAKRTKTCTICKEIFMPKSIKDKTCGSKECFNIYKSQSSKKYYKTKIKPGKHLDKGKSFPQQRIYKMLKKKFSNLIWEYDCRSIIKNPETNYALELDIWCPNLKLAIEYDGQHHFSSKIYGKKSLKYVQKMDEIKNQECKRMGIKLIRLNKDDDLSKKGIINKIGVL